MIPAFSLFLAVAVGYVLPGWLLSRRLGSPVPWLTAVPVSWALLFQVFFWLQVAGVSLTGWAVLVGCAAISLILAWGERRFPVAMTAHAGRSRSNPWSRCRSEWWWMAPVMAIVGVFLVRAWHQPLSGWDIQFRWWFLAEQMVRHHTFSFYPPVDPADYARYFHPDGMPPLVSCLYAWLGWSWGSLAPRLSIVPVAAQYVLLLAACGALACRLGGRMAGRYAVMVAASATFLSWAVLMGQETGLTALGMVYAWWLLTTVRHDGDWGRAVLAGVAAALVPLAREYGWIVLPLGLAACWWRGRKGWPVLLGFAMAMCLLAGPWYWRTWHLAGDPFYPLNPGGLFRPNLVYGGILEAYREHFGWGRKGWMIVREATWFMAVFAAWPWTIGLVGALHGLRRHGHVTLAIAAMIALWAYSVGVTHGGVAYSLRVLSPAMAMLAVAGGVWMARLGRHWTRLVGALRCGLMIACLVAVAAGLTFSKAWWTVPPGQWWACATAPQPPLPDFAGLGLPPGCRLLTDNADCHAALSGRGVDVVPVWSPEVAFLFDAGGEVGEQCRMLREIGIGHVLLTLGSVNLLHLRRYPLFGMLAEAAAGHPEAPFLLYVIPAAEGEVPR